MKLKFKKIGFGHNKLTKKGHPGIVLTLDPSALWQIDPIDFRNIWLFPNTHKKSEFDPDYVVFGIVGRKKEQ